jgi:hypothetical protein
MPKNLRILYWSRFYAESWTRTSEKSCSTTLVDIPTGGATVDLWKRLPKIEDDRRSSLPKRTGPLLPKDRERVAVSKITSTLASPSS